MTAQPSARNAGWRKPFATEIRGRVSPHSAELARAVTSLQKMMANELPSENTTNLCICLFSPVLANVIWIGGGSVGLLLVIDVVLLLRR